MDGKELAASSVNASARLDTVSWQNFRVGVGISKSLIDFFNGAIDDAAVWGSALPAAKLRALTTAGRHSRLRYDASKMEVLFDLFDGQEGEAVVDGLSWTYITGLEGSGGDVLDLGERIAIQLDDQGNGVVAHMPPAGYTLRCSEDDVVDGLDADCAGGTFGDGLWIYLWPEESVDTVDFYLDGVFHKTERFAPYELDGGSATSLSAGTHTVRAVVNRVDGGSEEVSVTFTVETPVASYTLRCSEDDVVDGLDADCAGGSISYRLGGYLYPIDRVLLLDYGVVRDYQVLA